MTQFHDQTECYNGGGGGAYISTVWRRGSLPLRMFNVIELNWPVYDIHCVSKKHPRRF